MARVKINIEPILPRNGLFDVQKMGRAMGNIATGLAKDINVDFGVTTQTFDHDVKFEIESAGRYGRKIYTTDEIYGYLNDGTRVRYATMTPDFQAKTQPRIIASQRGAGGVAYIRKDRPRPGIKARHFDDEIAKKWTRLAPGVVERAILAEL